MQHPEVAAYLKPMEKPVIVEFRTEAVKMEHASQQQGRPIYEDREFVTILIPGMRGTSANEPVNDEHKHRWPREYAAFLAGKEAPLDGTPLSEWPHSAMTKSRVQELAFFNIRTVEHLGDLDDAALQRLGMGAFELRETARKFLDVAKNGTAPLERMVMRALKAEQEVVRLTEELRDANAEAARLRAQLEKGPTNAGA